MLVRAGLACCGLQKSDVHLIIMNIVVKIVFTRTLLTVSESLTSCWPILRAKIGHNITLTQISLENKEMGYFFQVEGVIELKSCLG